MKRLIIVMLVGFLAWQGYAKHQTNLAARAEAESSDDIAKDVGIAAEKRDVTNTGQFRCDGRTYCSQMTSCAEATFFLNNCPGVKMDGDHDGIPCERQWCAP